MKILQNTKEYIGYALDLIYPSKTICYSCGKTIKGEEKYSLCQNCYKSLSFISDYNCNKCSVPLRMIEDGPYCESCKNTFYYFDKAIAVVSYQEDIKRLIYRFKYSNHTYLATTMAYMMSDKLEVEGFKIDLIIPIPLYKGKQRERGFNQSDLLSKYISEKINIPINTNTLIRSKNTKVMHKLSKRERQENVKDAFKVVDKWVIKDKSILLVDDIFTTGSTVNICSKLLTESGAKSIIVLTFARD